MKKLVVTVALTLVAVVIRAQSGCSFDTMPGIVWESVGGPPVHVTAYAQSGQRVFAATDYGLFYSDDPVASWQLQEQTRGKQIENLYANDTVVLFQTVRTVSQGPYSIPAQKRLEVYRSLDAGQTFNLLYDLDADSEYLWTQLAPYEWTGFTDPGGGFLYFDHGWPHLNYAPGLHPYEKTRYFSANYGKTWQSFFVSNQSAPGTLPASPLDLRLTFCNDTLLGVRAVQLPGGSSGTELNLYPHGNFGSNSWRDTLPAAVAYSDCIYFNQTLYVFNVGSAPTTVHRYKTVLTDSLSTVPEIDTLFFPQESQPPYGFWSSDTVLWFRFYGNNVYRASIQQPDAPIFAYEDLNNSYAGVSFAALPAGQLRCRANGATEFSADGGATWLPAHRHLTASATGQGARCGRPVAGPYSPGPLFELAPDGQWRYLDSTLEKGMRWVAGEAFGRFFLNGPDDKSYYTTACADDIAWTRAPFAGGWALRLTSGPGRAYAFQTNCFGCSVHKTLEGNIWKNAGFGSAGRLVVIGSDTFLFVAKDQVRYSFDGGSSWQLRFFPLAQIADWIVYTGGRLVAAKTATDGLRWYECMDWTFADSGGAWQEICTLDGTTFAYAAFGDAIVKPAPVSYSDNVIFLHAQGGLYLSGDGAHTWRRLPGLPFQQKFRIPHYTSGWMQYGAAEGANDYAVIGNDLYAYTYDEGVWRTAWPPIAAQLGVPMPGSEARSPGPRALEVWPNPASDMVALRVPEAGCTVYLCDAQGTIFRSRVVTGYSVTLELAGLPAGVYFLSAQGARTRWNARVIVAR